MLVGKVETSSFKRLMRDRAYLRSSEDLKLKQTYLVLSAFAAVTYNKFYTVSRSDPVCNINALYNAIGMKFCTQYLDSVGYCVHNFSLRLSCTLSLA